MVTCNVALTFKIWDFFEFALLLKKWGGLKQDPEQGGGE